MPAAVGLLTRAASLPSEDEAARIDLLLKLGEALYQTAELTRAEGVLQEAYDAAETIGDERLKARTAVLRLLLQALTEPQDWTNQATREVERLIPVFERFEDEQALARAWNCLHMVNLMRARYDNAAEASRQAAEHAKRAGEEREEVEGLALWASTAVFGTTPVAEGLRRCEEVLERASSYPTVEAQVLLGLAGLKAMNGEFDDARRLTARCRALWEGMGMKLAIVSSGVLFSAFVETLAGDLPAAEAELRWGYKALLEIGEQAVRATLAGSLASVLFDMGRLQEAEMFASACEEMAAPEDIDAQVLWRRVRARLLGRRADHVNAQPLAREALLLANRTDDLDLIAGATTDLAEVIQAAGGWEESRALLTTATNAYEQKGNRVAAARTRALLELSESSRSGGSAE
jgi:tetratricopeptide (TPR) repeat protein